MSDIRPSNAVIFAALSQAATVTPAGGSPVTTTVVWLAPTTNRLQGLEPMEDLRPRCAVRRDLVATLPVGSTISAARPPEFASPRTWIVDRVEDLDPDVFYAQVH